MLFDFKQNSVKYLYNRSLFIEKCLLVCNLELNIVKK